MKKSKLTQKQIQKTQKNSVFHNKCSTILSIRFQNYKIVINVLTFQIKIGKKERQHVKSLITKYADPFHIPGEPLGATTALQHNIPIIDDQPIFLK